MAEKLLLVCTFEIILICVHVCLAAAGLLRLMSSEDELAAVIAHETAHVLARHHAERMSQMNLTGERHGTS